MRFTRFLAGFAVACLPWSGTAVAQAAPVSADDRVLTANRLYRGGELQPGRCVERGVRPNHVPSAKRYLTGVLNCLHQSWGAYFERAGLPFAKSRIGFITKPRRYCGHPWGAAQATYCHQERRFLILLNRNVLDDPSDLYLFGLAAHEFGHHVQNLSGIMDAYLRKPYRDRRELLEQSRRIELQAECLAGVFIGSVWDSLDRTPEDWERLLEITRMSGDEHRKVRHHGKGRNIAAWLKKGFLARSPQACNTWTAPASKVA
ncbi:metalloprotease-like protein [Nonomuraea sp. NN258]|uniref:neutral zinc metallopeptidase n=1 Tax=Nonomuraea antri TaxID=2730852 RepID=UPI0015699223|nr:neutral zinc metallopeptidase [Nonomuraea antri]NRQ36723.1 metalloprotease-like protein [Nonomuraea antri]